MQRVLATAVVVVFLSVPLLAPAGQDCSNPPEAGVISSSASGGCSDKPEQEWILNATKQPVVSTPERAVLPGSVGSRLSQQPPKK